MSELGKPVRLELFDLIDQEGWNLPVDVRIDYSQGFPDVIILIESTDMAM